MEPKKSGRPTARINLTKAQRGELEAWTRRQTQSQRLWQRARIILECERLSTDLEVAEVVGVTAATVGKWRRRFVVNGIAGLADAPRPGGPRSIDDESIAQLLRMTLETKPRGATHWSTRSLAKKLGLSHATVGRVWRAFNVKPHQSESFSLSNDPFFVEKVRDVVGLYMSPPDNAIVLCVDEKSQIQALERSQLVLPMMPGVPERQTCRYLRHGTTTLFAALDVATGRVIGKCFRRHRAKEFLVFLNKLEAAVPDDLEAHVIMDNYGTHRTPKVRAWFERHQRFHAHFVPTYSSWLNLVERWFAELTTRQLRRSSHRSTAALEHDIREFIEVHNDEPKPYIWTKSADDILASIARYCARLHDATS